MTITVVKKKGIFPYEYLNTLGLFSVFSFLTKLLVNSSKEHDRNCNESLKTILPTLNTFQYYVELHLSSD